MPYNGKVGTSDNLNIMLGENSRTGDPLKDQAERYSKLLERYGKQSADSVEQYREALIKKHNKQQKAELKAIEKEIWDENASRAQKLAKNIGETLSKALSASLTKTFSSIDSYIQSYTQYMGSITTRLQGTGLSFNTLASNISRNLGTSPYLKQTDMLNNLNKFVEAGIAYNVESRAYIATATQKIATTFDAFDSSLLRIIRIQQADSTVARVGMESLLTKFLNAQYQDTSYLNRSQNISGMLTEAESLMGYKGASEFEYVVQKWLGSMSALGVSENTISALATGLGYLGSGNVSALSGNTALQNLLVMAASNAGLDYGSLLTGGLNANTTNALLSSIVGIGQNIAYSGNNVVRSQYANLFGLNVSDLVSLTNITANDLKEITGNIVSYEQMRAETSKQLATMSQRTTTSEKVQNVLSNMLAGLGANIATNPGLYGLWEVATLMANSGLDWNINLGFLGTGTSTPLSTMLKTGVVGVSGLISAISAIGNIASGNAGGTRLDAWGEVETRGSGLSTTGFGSGNGYRGISGRTLSSSSYIGSVDSSALSENFRTIQEETTSSVGEQEDSELEEAVKVYIKEDVHYIRELLTDWNTRMETNPFMRFGLGG